MVLLCLQFTSQQPTVLLSVIALHHQCRQSPLKILYAALLSKIVSSVTQDQAPSVPNANKAFYSLLWQGVPAYVRISYSNNVTFNKECKVDNCWKCAEPSSSTATESTKCSICQAGYLLNPADGSCFKHRCDSVTHYPFFLDNGSNITQAQCMGKKFFHLYIFAIDCGTSCYECTRDPLDSVGTSPLCTSCQSGYYLQITNQ